MIFQILFLIFLTNLALAQNSSLIGLSKRINTDLPEKYDSITKLQSTSVQNDNLIYHFIVDANQLDFDGAFPKVKQQILSTVCSKPREKNLFTNQKANLVYRYENGRGQSLGEFMIRAEHCSRK